MGWKTDLILIEGDVVSREELLEVIGRPGYSIHKRGTCGDMFPPRSLVIGAYSGCTLVADPKLPTSIIDYPAGQDANRLVANFADRQILCCVLHSVVNLAAFALYEKGELKRCFAASGDDGVFASTGKVLSAERKVTSQYAEISNGDGEIVYVDDDGETFTLDALGEDIVFEIVSMMTGKRPDRDEELFSAPADIYSKPPVLRALFRW